MRVLIADDEAPARARLAALLDDTLGVEWAKHLDMLRGLEPLADDADFRARWRDIKRHNKLKLAHHLRQVTGIAADPDSLFDVQVKRIHEYKRQLLNVLHAIHLYDRIRRGDGDELVPRAIIIGGKAAPGYLHDRTDIPMAKQGFEKAKGIRIEDDVAVTRDEPRILTGGLAKTADDIEALMAA